jgi:hypothetical protein
MHAGHDYHLIVNNSVEKAIRKTTQIYTTCLTVNNSKAFRVPHQRFNDVTYGRKKLVTKTGSLILIPSVSVFNVCGSTRPEDRWLHLDRERICCRTWSQGIPSGPERSRSSSRRSSSSRCAFVSGTLPGFSLRLSHNSSIRRRRSSGLRSRMFSSGLLINRNMPSLQFLCHRGLCPLAQRRAQPPLLAIGLKRKIRGNRLENVLD